MYDARITRLEKELSDLKESLLDIKSRSMFLQQEDISESQDQT